MKKVSKLVTTLTTILILLIGVWFITVLITGSEWYYDWQFRKNNTLEELSWETTTEPKEIITYTEEDLDNIKKKIIGFLFGKEESMQIEIDGHNFFSLQALNHMKDVKKVYKTWTIITIICMVLLIPCILFFIKHFKEVKSLLFRQTSIVYICISAILLIIVVFIVVDFDWTFTNFHHILFPNKASFDDAFFSRVSNYAIDNQNPYINNLMLISVLSIDVFLDAAWIIISFILLIMVLWFSFALYIKKKSQS